MDCTRSLVLLLTAGGLLALCGAGCPNMVRPPRYPLPVALPPSPTLEQVIAVVNRNNSQIQSFSTNEAKLSGAGFPTLRASIAFEQPKRLRLRAETGLTGPEIDLGSNDERFWFWIRRNQPPAVYHCRHDQFAASPARQMTPLEPSWLIEALGIAEFDPSLPHQGPIPLAGGKLQIRTIKETPDGPATKVTVVDGSRGIILEQRLFDARGQLLAASVASGHRQDPLTGLVMPTVVELNSPPTQFSARIELGNVRINRPTGDPAELWTMPSYPGSPPTDLCNPSFQPSVAAPAAVGALPSRADQRWSRRVR